MSKYGPPIDRARLAASHELLAEFAYEPVEIQRGYANRSLQVDLSTNQITTLPVTDELKRIFVGGRGFGLYYLWHSVTPETRWMDPDNAIVICSGPLGGNTTFSGSGKSLVVSLSPATGIPIDSNVGGHFGPLLKFSGWDALVLRGKAERDVVVYIDGNHTLPYVINDLIEWSKKVRVGGIVSGHDYRKSKRIITQNHVVYAVHCYTESYRINPWFLLGRKAQMEGEVRDDNRSWMWVKIR